MKEKDYIQIMLDMLVLLTKDDMSLFAIVLNASMLYKGIHKVTNKESIETLIDEVVSIFSKAKEQLKEAEEYEQ